MSNGLSTNLRNRLLHNYDTNRAETQAHLDGPPSGSDEHLYSKGNAVAKVVMSQPPVCEQRAGCVLLLSRSVIDESPITTAPSGLNQRQCTDRPAGWLKPATFGHTVQLQVPDYQRCYHYQSREEA